MGEKRTYFGFTTAQQRKLMFETWEATGSVTKACETARVSRRLFYYWKGRFDQQGYAGLEHYESRVPKRLAKKKDAAIEQRVVAMKRANPEWGKTRISQEMAKANNWVPLVSPNAVRRILVDAGLWTEPVAGEKRRSQ